jgi:hypothetical protein
MEEGEHKVRPYRVESVEMADEGKQSKLVEAADPTWFREPTRREHRIGAALFIGFGVFYLLLFFVLRGWWFRWVILGLAVFSTVRGLKHVAGARRKGTSP